MGSVIAPATELQRRTLSPDAQLMDAVAGVHRVVHGVHPATHEPRQVRTFGVEVERHGQAILVKWP
jgi:hypothetical protein